MNQRTSTLTSLCHKLKAVSAPPDSLQIRAAKIPKILRLRPRWVLWRYQLQNGKWKKVPHQPNGSCASSTAPMTWHSFPTVLNAYRGAGWDGIGFVLGGGVVGVDLDHCRNPLTGEILAWAQKIIDHFDSYTERSPSGTGCHIYFLASTIIGRKQGLIEAYSANRFFAVTGQGLNDKGIEARQSALNDFVAKHFGTTKRDTIHGLTATSWSAECVDREIPTTVRARFTVKRHRDKDFAALCAGKWQELGRYTSQSEADLALVTKLLRVTRRDPALADLLFRMSGLMDQKWERVDYRERTLDRAMWQRIKPLTDRDGTAKRLLEWLKRHGPEVSKRHCFRACSDIPKEALKKALQKLERRHGVRTVVKRSKAGGRSSRVIRVHPRLF